MPARIRPSCPSVQRSLAVAAALAVMAALGMTDAAGASARGRAPWCGNLSGHSLDDCNYFTFEQCLVSVHGLGGFCTRNPAPGYVLDSRTRKVRRIR